MGEVKGELISRNAVIDVLKETGIIQDNDLGHLVIEEINRIPAAYDVQKVIEQEHNYLTTLTSPHTKLYENVMRIVRNGGKE